MSARTTEAVAYSPAAIRNNGAVIEYCRTTMAAMAGATAGILGLTSVWGFLFMLLSSVLLWLLLLLKAGTHWQQHFISRKALLSSGLFSGALTYVLLWTFLYGMVHVY